MSEKISQFENQLNREIISEQRREAMTHEQQAEESAKSIEGQMDIKSSIEEGGEILDLEQKMAKKKTELAKFIAEKENFTPEDLDLRGADLAELNNRIQKLEEEIRKSEEILVDKWMRRGEVRESRQEEKEEETEETKKQKEIVELERTLDRLKRELITTSSDLIDAKKAEIKEIERLIREKEEQWASRKGFYPIKSLLLEPEEQTPKERGMMPPSKERGMMPPPKERGMMPPSKDVKPEKVVISDISEIVKRYAWSEAEQKLRNYLYNSKWYKRWFARLGEKGYLLKFYHEALEEIRKNRNLMTEIQTRLLRKSSGEVPASFEVEHFRVIDEILDEYAEELVEAEERGDIINNKQVNDAIAQLIRDYAAGRITDRIQFDQRVEAEIVPLIRAAGAHWGTDSRERDACGLMYASNLWQLAEGYKEDLDKKKEEATAEHGQEQKENIDKFFAGIENLDVQLGLKERDLYETKPKEVLKWYEKMVNFTQRIPVLNKILANSVSYGVIGGVIGGLAGRALTSRTTAGVMGAVAVAAPVVAPLATAGIMGGGFAAARRGRDLEYDRGLAFREKTLGKTPGGERTERVLRYGYDVQDAGQIIQSLESIDKLDSGEARDLIIDARARLKAERAEKVDLIGVSEEEEVKHKTKLLARNKIKRLLRDIEEDFGPIDERLVNEKVKEYHNHIQQKNKEWAGYKRGEMVKAGLFGALFGVAAGAATQEAWALVSRHLPIEKIPLVGEFVQKHWGMKGKRTWPEKLADLVRGRDGKGAGLGAEILDTGYPRKFDWSHYNTGKGKLEVPDFLGHKDATGNFIKGAPSTDGVWYDEKGDIIYNSKTGYKASGWNSEHVNGPYEGGRRIVPSDEWLKELKPGTDERVIKIDHDGWYTQDTEKIFDYNEKRLHWGGIHRSGLDEKGNIVMDVGKMKAYDSWNTVLGKPKGTVNVQELISQGKGGPIKLLFYSSTGKEGTVLEHSLTNNKGQFIMDAQSNVGKFFKVLDASNRQGLMVDVLAKDIEVVQELVDENGVVHIIPLATEVGEGLKGIEIKEMFDDWKLLPPSGEGPVPLPKTVPPPVYPFYPRYPLEIPKRQGEKREEELKPPKKKYQDEEGKPPIGPKPEEGTGGEEPFVPPVISPKHGEKGQADISPEDIGWTEEEKKKAEEAKRKWEETEEAKRKRKVAVRGAEEELLPHPPHEEEYLGAKFPRKFDFKNSRELAAYIVSQADTFIRLRSADWAAFQKLSDTDEKMALVEAAIKQEIAQIEIWKEQLQEAIQEVRQVLKETLKKYGVKNLYFPKDEDIYPCGYYLYHAQNQENRPFGTAGKAYILNGAIFINMEYITAHYQDQAAQVAAFKETLIHEIVHDASTHNYWHYTTDAKTVDEYFPRRLGLMFWRGQKSREKEKRGRGLTEAVTQEIALEAVRKMFPDWGDRGIYAGERKILGILMKDYGIPKELFVQSLTDRKRLPRLIREMESPREGKKYEYMSKESVGLYSFSIVAGLMNYEASIGEYNYPLTESFLRKQKGLILLDAIKPYLPAWMWRSSVKGARIQDWYDFIKLETPVEPSKPAEEPSPSADERQKREEPGKEEKVADLKEVALAVQDLWVKYRDSQSGMTLASLRLINKPIGLIYDIARGREVDNDSLLNLIGEINRFNSDLPNILTSLKISSTEQLKYETYLAVLKAECERQLTQ